MKEYGKHPNGNIVGATINDFIVLPQRAKITIVYEGEVGAEGFLGFRRM